MATTDTTPATRTGARVHVQKFGTFLSNMVMPNIGAFIAWGLITALFIEVGWLPKLGIGDSPGSWVADIGGWGDNAGGGIVGPMITYLLPILIGYTGGKMVYDTRGGVVGAIATMGVIAGTEIPMFMGAMIMGPLGGWSMKHIDAIWDGKIKPGFEMLVNNFAAGIWGGILATFGYFVMSPIVTWISDRLGEGVDWLVNNDVLPLTSLIIEPAKVLFLNNAINHGVLTPLGTAEAVEQGKSVLFLLEANPGPGLGLLTAYMVFGRGLAKASAPGAAIIHFLGGIHEIYFPYVLMKPKLIVAMIAGGMTGVFLNVLFDVGLRAPAAPGSIFAVYAQVATDSYLGVTIAVLGSAAVTFLVAGFLLRTDKAEEADDQLVHATTSMEAMKGKTSIASSALAGAGAAPATDTVTATRAITSIVFACDAGMGSSAMGASVLRKKIHDAGHGEVTVVNKAIANLDDSYDLVVTHQDLTDRARQKTPSAVHVSVDNFMASPRYDEIVQMVDEGKRA
jgi:PTS system mannitol-specific IIC component